VEHFLATFERIARQQGWPEEVWATQLAGLLTGKALAAYAGPNGESAASYAEVKKAIFHRYDVSEETHRRRFRTDQKSPEESFQNWGDRLRDHFDHWTKDQKMPLAELMVLDQFLGGVPEDLRVWLKERKPESLQQAVELAEETLAQGGGKRKTTVVTAQPPIEPLSLLKIDPHTLARLEHLYQRNVAGPIRRERESAFNVTSSGTLQ